MEEHRKRKTNQFNSISSARLKYVKLDHIFLMSIVCMVLVHLSNFTFVYQIWNHPITHFFAQIIICLAIFISICFMGRPRSVYLVDFACHKPDPEQKCTRELCMKRSVEIGCFTEDSLHFMRKILEKSGYGEMTYGPKGLMRNPRDQSLVESIDETEMVMYGAVDELLKVTGIEPREIGILIVNSSLFNPTPSLSARILNHYNLRENISSYSLAGMGCSAGLISIDLAKHLLQVNRNTYALIVSTENITRNFYNGNQRSMLVTNCLFRIGAAAILLSNNPIDHFRSKYQLIHTIRTHLGANDNSFNCVMQQEDNNQIVGVSLSKDLMEVAGEALKANITTLGPLVFPLSEKLKFLMTNIIGKRVFKLKIKSYIPDFKLAFEHFCIHAGGRGVLDELEKNLKLTKWHMEPSRMTLYRYGNTSSSSLWYELAYSEAKGRVKKGDRVWQIGFGSGFKCNSVVWRALRSIHPDKDMKNNPWIDEIDQFPADVPQVKPIVC